MRREDSEVEKRRFIEPLESDQRYADETIMRVCGRSSFAFLVIHTGIDAPQEPRSPLTIRFAVTRLWDSTVVRGSHF